MRRTQFNLTSPLASGTLLFAGMTATQAVSELEEIELDVLSSDPDIAAEALLGKPMGVIAMLRDLQPRQWNGIVMRFGAARPQGRHFGYRVSLRPWLWLLTRTTDSRIFQNETVPQIVEKVFADFPAAHFKFSLSRSYSPRIYCVQYRESDYNFIARLLEEEGIWWTFEHAEGRHQLVLVDEVSALQPIPGNPVLPFYGQAGSGAGPAGLSLPDIDHVDTWSFSREVQTGKVALTSYDFERPSVSLLTEAALVRSHEQADFEQFDHAGEAYTQAAEGRRWAEDQLEETQSRHERLSGTTNAMSMTVGRTFSLTRHAREDQNADLFCQGTRISAQLTQYEGGGGDTSYRCSFTAAPVSHPFRARRRTPKPFVQGPQTAVVVGPAGEELFTDKYGRVKVQFHYSHLEDRIYRVMQLAHDCYG